MTRLMGARDGGHHEAACQAQQQVLVDLRWTPVEEVGRTAT
jgi:hypothetical protein